jgi:predicted negative regulator of RcsB-dependent stress response
MYMYNYTHIRGKSDALSPMHMHTTLVTLVNRKEETDNKREIRKMEKKKKRYYGHLTYLSTLHSQEQLF